MSDLKVVLNYDPATGSISDKLGCHIFNWMNLAYDEVPQSNSTTEINDLIKLKESGFTVEEITSLRDRGLI